MYFDQAYSNKYYTMISENALDRQDGFKAERIPSLLFPEIVVVEPLVRV